MDIGNSNWNEDDASNTTAAPDGAPEGMAPSGVNNVLRAIMGAVKRWYGWSGSKLTGGTSTAYTLTYAVSPGALVDGMTHLVEFDQANGTAPTLNVNALGAIPLHYYSAGAWRALPPGLFGANEVNRVAYHSASGAYRLVGLRNGTGETREFAGSSAPPGSLLCDGAAYSRTVYAGLFAVIGTSHGAGDGSTTFNVPNHTIRVVIGGAPGTTGGASTHAHSVSGGASGGISVFGSTGGDFGPTINVTPSGGGVASNTGHQHNVTSTGTANLTVSGSTNAQSNYPPWIGENKIVRI